MFWKNHRSAARHSLLGQTRCPASVPPIPSAILGLSLIIACILISPAPAAEPAHPSLLFSQQALPALRAKTQGGWTKGIFDNMKKKADQYLVENIDPATRYNSAGGGRAMHFHTATLALTGILLEDRRYIDKATSIVMAVAERTNSQDFYDLNEQLAVADGAHTYAVLYDWLYPYLTEAQRTLLRNEMIEFAEWLYDYSISGKYYGRYSEAPLSCNHNSVHHSALGLCALALGDRPEWVARANQFVAGYFKYSLDATGYSYEGIGYSGYGYLGGGAYSVALKRAGGPNLIKAEPKNALLLNHLLHQMAPWGGEFIAMNDSTDRLGNSSGMMHLITIYQDRVGLWNWLKLFGFDGDNTYGGEITGSAAGALSYLLIFADPSLQPLSPADAGTPTNILYDSGRASWRTGWGGLDAMVTFTSGYEPHRGHNHKDENSFTFYSRGEKFIIDPTYQPRETSSHNTVLVDGQGQLRDEDEYDVYGKVIDTQDFGVAWAIKGEAKNAFPGALGVGRAQRQLLFASGQTPYTVIVDDYEKTSSTLADYTWLLHTDKNNTMTIDPNGLGATIQGNRRKALCRVLLLNPTQGISLTESDLSTRTGVSLGRAFFQRNYFKELQATVRAVNPRFAAVIVAADTLTEMPVIRSQGAPPYMTIELEWPNKDKDQVILSGGRFQFHRSVFASSPLADHSSVSQMSPATQLARGRIR